MINLYYLVSPDLIMASLEFPIHSPLKFIALDKIARQYLFTYSAKLSILSQGTKMNKPVIRELNLGEYDWQLSESFSSDYKTKIYTYFIENPKSIKQENKNTESYSP